MPRVITIFADGLGFHYTKNALVCRLLKDIFHAVIPLRSILGFSSGIVPSIWTSNYPSDHGYWAMWMLKKNYTLHPIKIKYLEWVLSCLTLYGIKRIKHFLGKPSFLKPSIPRSIRQFFICKDIDVTEPFILENPPSIFLILKENGIKNYYSFCQKVEDISFPDGDYDILTFHLGEFDGLGHSFGPESEIITSRIFDFLEVVKVLVKKTDFLYLFSDHGMFPLNSRVNLLERLSKLESRLGKDYLVFLDASMARFWFFSDDSEEEVTYALSHLKHGHFLKPEEVRRSGLSFRTNAYGDKIYLLEPSIEVYPNFFHPIYKGFFKGMHGYTPLAKNSYGLLATTFNLSRDEGTLLDISPTLLKILGLSSPKTWRGKSLVDFFGNELK